MTLAPLPLPPAAPRLLAVTAKAWGLMPCGAPARPRAAPASRPVPQLGASSAAELSQWPYWPALPSAGVGWR